MEVDLVASGAGAACRAGRRSIQRSGGRTAFACRRRRLRAGAAALATAARTRGARRARVLAGGRGWLVIGIGIGIGGGGVIVRGTFARPRGRLAFTAAEAALEQVRQIQNVGGLTRFVRRFDLGDFLGL